MKLTQKLIGYLNRVFDRGTSQVLALRLRYDGTGMTWRIADGTLTTAVSGGTGAALSVPLSQYSVAELGAFLAAQPGYSVPYQDLSTFTGLSALVLLDGEGDQSKSNGDHLNGFTSVLWAYMDSIASELTLLNASIAEAIKQLSAKTAEGEWVDEHGSYYNVKRENGEQDVAYVARMISELIRARGNNISIADAVERAIGGSEWAWVRVLDHKSTTTAGDGTKSYGLFDLYAEVDVDGPLTFAQIDTNLRAALAAMRDAGTHLRMLKYTMKSKLKMHAGAVLSAGSDIKLTNYVEFENPQVFWTESDYWTSEDFWM